MKPLQLVAGVRYNMLTVIGPTDETSQRSDRKVRLWKFSCDCGNTTNQGATWVVQGHVKSCGCLGRPTRRDPVSKSIIQDDKIRAAAWRMFQANYVYWDKRQGWLDTCSFEHFLKLSQQPCHYCGTQELTCYFYHRSKTVAFQYNTLDRKDSSLGHTVANVVPCCKQCNRAKQDTPYQDFLDWIQRCHNYLFK